MDTPNKNEIAKNAMQKIMEDLWQILRLETPLSTIERDLLLQNLREAYLLVLSLGVSDSATSDLMGAVIQQKEQNMEKLLLAVDGTKNVSADGESIRSSEKVDLTKEVEIQFQRPEEAKTESLAHSDENEIKDNNNTQSGSNTIPVLEEQLEDMKGGPAGYEEVIPMQQIPGKAEEGSLQEDQNNELIEEQPRPVEMESDIDLLFEGVTSETQAAERSSFRIEEIKETIPVPELSFSQQQDEPEYEGEDDLISKSNPVLSSQDETKEPENITENSPDGAPSQTLSPSSIIDQSQPESIHTPFAGQQQNQNASEEKPLSQEPQQKIPDSAQQPTTMRVEQNIYRDKELKEKNTESVSGDTLSVEKSSLKTGEPTMQKNRSLNDLLTENRNDNSLNTRFQNARIQDLTKSISINDKFLFIKELFKNRGEDFSAAIQKLNSCHTIDEAFEYMDQLKGYYLWDSTSPAYLSFCDLIRRKF